MKGRCGGCGYRIGGGRCGCGCTGFRWGGSCCAVCYWLLRRILIYRRNFVSCATCNGQQYKSKNNEFQEDSIFMNRKSRFEKFNEKERIYLHFVTILLNVRMFYNLVSNLPNQRIKDEKRIEKSRRD
jgi:hypothetical protein